MTALKARLAALVSDPNPILLKELRATFRTNLFVRFLYLVTAAVAMAVLCFGAIIASNDLPPATVGQILFQLFLGAGLFVIVLVAPGYASAAITAEHEQQTWESLELSGIGAGRLVWGKLAACYASIALVLVALSPVVGIAFLFGGVSPWQVLVGFVSLLIALVPAVAYGVAISARLRSTRLAIVLATVTYFPVGIFGVTMLAILGDELRYPWGLSMQGPFFYTEAFVTRAGEWDTWAILFVAPLWAIAMPVWFLLATAVTAVRPAAEDRARSLKVWAIAMSASAVPAIVLMATRTASTRDQGEISVVACMFATGVLLLYGVLFTNEPTLPPRSWELRASRAPAWRRALGPGTAGTMRFSLVLSFCTALAVVGAAYLAQHVFGGEHDLVPTRYDLACAVAAAGGLAVAAFAATLGAYLRVVLANGLAARVLTLAIVAAGAVLPLMAALLVSPSSLDDLNHRSPLLVTFSVLEPLFLAVQTVERGGAAVWQIAIPVALSGGAAIVFGVLVEQRVKAAREARAARRARFEERLGG